MHVPEEVIEPSRIGFAIMLPWTWSIAYRRFNQGIMIRFGHSDAVGAGTVLRLFVDAIMLFAGYALGGVSGIVVGSAAQAMGVLSEAVYAGIRVRSVIQREVKQAPKQPDLGWGEFTHFFAPLVLTAFLNLVWNSIGSAALSRMNTPVQSLAVWPVVSGLIFLLRTPGIAINEVVVAMLDRPGMEKHLRRFGTILSGTTSAAFLLFALTPLAGWWFLRVSALPEGLADLARNGFWLGLPLPMLSVLQSWYQGNLLHKRQTRGISESLAIFLLTVIAILAGGVYLNNTTGIYVVMIAYLCANVTQTAWLGYRFLSSTARTSQ